MVDIISIWLMMKLSSCNSCTLSLFKAIILVGSFKIINWHKNTLLWWDKNKINIDRTNYVGIWLLWLLINGFTDLEIIIKHKPLDKNKVNINRKNYVCIWLLWLQLFSELEKVPFLRKCNHHRRYYRVESRPDCFLEDVSRYYLILCKVD